MVPNDLPEYIPLEKAAQHYHIDSKLLQQAVQDETIRAVRTERLILVAVEDVARIAVQTQAGGGFVVDPELQGRPIRVTEAAEKYGVKQPSLSRWAESGYIRVIKQSPKLLLLDEGDVKRTVTIFHRVYRETGSYVQAGRVLKRILGQQMVLR